MGMTWPDVWALVHTERRLLADDLAALDAAAWDVPSLCGGWSVHDVVAHLVDTAHMGRRGFVTSMARARGDFDLANAHGVARHRHDDPARTLDALRATVDLRRTPPAHRATRLVEVFVHGEDVRRPLGLEGRYPRAGLYEAIAHQLRTRRPFGGGREIAAGLRLTDGTTSWGEGPEVAGRTIDLLLVATGRHVDPGLLAGPGASTLVARL
ncbi:maleylpyruvate isomerase family mycothiol-dependent enzyme [Sanguibacter sp. HDW7]|uniref:maleylpyruvate isomerase family mycothiol-dependent enzyme n=1 Tax=Sanguibacter sp. HDW7 TaxID=2714931 RepID=UPI001407E5D2|nr:maleylpyruvate isomerase family mycothiol-dependent enzyme [Sanguibacter sp. HDW7]QIK84060.1 maleylpyruvate isomerase family mycothiol-dependent enzyme [Sanguibacter sp. HDW7]